MVLSDFYISMLQWKCYLVSLEGVSEVQEGLNLISQVKIKFLFHRILVVHVKKYIF